MFSWCFHFLKLGEWKWIKKSIFFLDSSNVSIYWFSELNFYVRYTECTVYFTLYIFYLKRLDQKIFEPVIIWDRETGLLEKILKNNDSQNYSIIEGYYFYKLNK